MEVESEIESQFHSASTYIASNSNISLSNDTKLKLYALFKQAVVGDCNTQKPTFDFTGRAKHTAWSNVKGMEKNEAMKAYIQTVTALECGWPEGNMKADIVGKKEKGQGNQGMGNTVSTMAQLDEENEPINLFYHIKEGNLSEVRRCLDESENKDINLTDNQGLQPLHWACDRGHLDIVLLLIERGAALNGLSNDGETPFYFACASEQLEVARLLVKLGADTSIKDADGRTALEDADENFRMQVFS